MTKVYVVLGGLAYTSGCDVLGVYAEESLANQCCDDHRANYDYVDVTEYEVE